MQKYLTPSGIEIAGWLCGLAVVAAGDYVLIPKLVEQIGQLTIAIVVGLVLGAMIMFVFGEMSHRVASATRKQRDLGKSRTSHARRLSLTTRVFTLLVVLTVLALLLSELLPLASFK